MIIDFHTHSFSNKIAEKTILSLKQSCGIMFPYTDGTLDGLRCNMRDNGIDLSVVLNIATRASQHEVVNNYASELNKYDDIISFGSVFPGDPSALSELNRIASLGLKGIKLHPDYQGFFVDDESLFPLYEKISSLGLITVFHSGYDLGLYAPCHCTPKRLSRILDVLTSPVIAAHFGGVMLGEDVLEYLAGKDIYLDTSFSYGRLAPSLAKQIVKAHGSEKILFGTDSPWSGAKEELAYLHNLGLAEDELSNILGDNASRLLGL